MSGKSADEYTNSLTVGNDELFPFQTDTLNYLLSIECHYQKWVTIFHWMTIIFQPLSGLRKTDRPQPRNDGNSGRGHSHAGSASAAKQSAYTLITLASAILARGVARIALVRMSNKARLHWGVTSMWWIALGKSKP